MDYFKSLNFPGEYPFTRGVYPTMYRGKIWTIRQVAGYGTVTETNKRYKYLFDHGQTGLSVEFDLVTQCGYDPDHTLAVGEVGKVGVSISSLRDMEMLFDGIPLSEITTSMTINATCMEVLSMYVAVAKKQGTPSHVLSGTVQNDILKEYIARGAYIYPLEPSMRIVTDIITYCAENMPRFNPISISGYHIRESGASAVQELAFSFGNAIAYIENVIQKGLNIDSFAPRLSFFFAVHNNFFEEIAKFRAARRLWAKLMKEKFKAKNPKSMILRFHAQTGGSTLTAQEPVNNIVRTTIQALAAVLGGTQSLHTNSMDEPFALPSEEAVKIAVRTQQIIAHESGVADTIDPIGGSYFLESLTNEIEEKTIDYLEKIESIGGMLKAIESGFIQKEIVLKSYEYQKKIESGAKKVLGMNMFRAKEEPQINLFRVNPKVEDLQKKRLSKLKEQRNHLKVQHALKEVRKIAEDPNKNLIPSISKAVTSYATIGEISTVLREVFGEYKHQ
jgi:methylmalonyl-CoA mutase N-terminal domain/subunit